MEFNEFNRKIEDGTFSAYIVIDMSYDNGIQDEFGFKIVGSISEMADSFTMNTEKIVSTVLTRVFKEKARNMNSRWWKNKTTLKELKKLDKLRHAVLQLYNKLAIKTDMFKLYTDDLDESTINDLVERILVDYLDSDDYDKEIKIDLDLLDRTLSKNTTSMKIPDYLLEDDTDTDIDTNTDTDIDIDDVEGE